jgi:hypothetical protein
MIMSKGMRWAGRVARPGEKRTAYRILAGKPEEKRQVGRPKRRWMDIITIDLRVLGWSDMDRVDLVQDRGQWRALVLNIRVP